MVLASSRFQSTAAGQQGRLRSLPAPPSFRRSPRICPELPKGEFEIPAPPPAPSQQSVQLLPVLLPGAFAIAFLVMTILLSRQSNPLYLVMSGGFMLISSLTSLLSYFGQRRSHRRALESRDEKYRALLADRRQKLGVVREQQRATLCQIDPDPGECLRRVARRPPDSRLWERAPTDPDFLALRVGLGSLPLPLALKTPSQQNPLEADPLVEAAQGLARQFERTPDVPICLPLREAAAAGVAGPRERVLGAVRTLVAQIATHHAPDEVKIVALFPREEAMEWEWLRWLPHVWSDRSHRLLACEPDAATQMLDALYSELNRRRGQMTIVSEGDRVAPLPRYVFILADPGLIESDRILPLLLKEGAALGAYPIFLADRVDGLPKGCRAIVEVTPAGGRLIQTAPIASQHSFEPDPGPSSMADRLARAMAPIRYRAPASGTEVPDLVTLLDLFGMEAVEELDVAGRWRSSSPFVSLAVPIGRRTGGELQVLDLQDSERAHGPHGLIAGGTGSGKSELLMSLIGSLAVSFHPHELTFVLIDYKGGEIIGPCAELPHLVGQLSSLDKMDKLMTGNLVARVQAAIRAELDRRQALRNQAGVKDVNEYQRLFREGKVREPMPHTVLIVDEFADLGRQHPDFIRELVAVSQLGRTLGLHLILAAQQPAGVVSDQMWGQLRFHICLMMREPQDSQAVLRRPDAATLNRRGRAYFQVGYNEVFELFQGAWANAPYTPGAAALADPREIVAMALDGSRRPLRLSPEPIVIQKPPSQLRALVAHLRDVAAQQGIQRLRGFWLPPLPERVVLDQVRAAEGWDGHDWQPIGSWLEPVVGLVDDPIYQHQGPLRLRLGQEGHLAVYGAPGTGKTTFVQTLVASLALNHSPHDVQFYLLDFGGEILRLFEGLPHVGSVITADDAERLQRLFRFLERQLELRKQGFAQAGVTGLPAFRRATAQRLPAIVVVLDNYTGFASAYPDDEERLAQIAREGGNFGIHLVLTANAPSAIRTKVSNNIKLAVTMQLADQGDYGSAVGRTGGLVPAPVPGRGLIKGAPPLEFQTALPAPGEDEAERTAALRALFQQMEQAWSGPRPDKIPVLPDVAPLCSLLPPADGWAPAPGDGSLRVPVGLEVASLEPLAPDLNEGPHFIISGPFQCGKTTLLQSWILALAERFAPDRLALYLVDLRRSGLWRLGGLPHCRACCLDDDSFGEALNGVARALHERRQVVEEARQAGAGASDDRPLLARYPALVLAIDDFDAVRDEVPAGTKERLEQLVRRERRTGFHVLVAGSTSDLSSSYEGWIKALRDLQTGFLLGTTDHSDLQFFNLKLPIAETGKALRPGLGYFARRTRHRQFLAATCHQGAVTLPDWVLRIAGRAARSSACSETPGGEVE